MSEPQGLQGVLESAILAKVAARSAAPSDEIIETDGMTISPGTGDNIWDGLTFSKWETADK